MSKGIKLLDRLEVLVEEARIMKEKRIVGMMN